MRKLLLIPIIFILSLLTVQAQIDIGNISDTILGDLTYDVTAGLKPDIITLNENITIIAYTDGGNDGFVVTVNISSSNASIFNVISSFEYDNANGFESRIIKVFDTIYAIAFRSNQADGFIVTVNISNQGVISQAVIDTLEFDTGNSDDPDIIKVNDSVYALAYRGVDTDGFITTVDISNTGQIGAVLDTFEFESINADDIDILNITDNNFVMVFRGKSPLRGVVSTINIANDGTIGTLISNATFDIDGSDPEIIRIGTSTTYAIVYQNSTSNGRIKTFEILDNGSIIGELDSEDYDTAGTDVNAIKISNNVIGLVYSGVGNDGFVRTFTIQTDGTINLPSIDVLEFDTTNALNPRITQVIGNIFSVAYENSGSLGVTRTFNITVPLPPINLTNLDVFLSKNPVEILEQFTLFANYTNATDNQPVLNATCFANSSVVGGGQSGFGRGVLGIGGLSTVDNAVHTQVNDIFGNNTLRVDIDNIPLGKASYGVNFRFHAHNQTPDDNLRVFATCHNNLTFSNFTLIGQVNTTETVISISTGNDTIWGFKNVVLFGQSVASENCSIVFESINTSLDKHWMIADTVSNLNLNNSFTSIDFGETYVLRTNADTRSPFVDAGFGLDVPNETTMIFNSTSGLYFLDNIRHGRPFDFIDRVFCSADNFENATDFVITNVQDNNPPIVQINSITPSLAVLNVDNVTIQWSVNDPELLFNIINVSFPNGSLLIQTDEKPLILTPDNLTITGNYTVVAFANDTGGLSTTANATFEVADVDITIPVIILISPANNTAQNTVPLNITFSVTDNFPNDIICILQNSTFVFDTGTFTQGANSNLTLAEGSFVLSQEFPNLELTCFDNSVPFNNSATLLLNYTLDTNPPVIQTFNPADQIRFNKQIFSEIEISGNCSDVPVFNFNITVTNDTDTIATFSDNTPVNNVLSIKENITITNLGVGFYTVNYTCADTHTRNRLSGDYNVRKNNSDFSIKWIAPDGNQFRIRYLQNSIAFNSFGSRKVRSGDRYDFFFNSNESESERTFIFEILSRKKVFYLQDSSYKAHFITGNNWIDFEFDDPDATYVITKNGNGNWEVEITTVKAKLNFNSIGELNIATISTTFEIFSIVQIVDFFTVDVCRTDTGSVIFLGLMFIISLILITMAMATKVGFIGVFGALMLLFTSLRIVPCIRIVATILIFLSILLFFFFIFRGFWPSLTDQQRPN